jgi:hypothetical protein
MRKSGEKLQAEWLTDGWGIKPKVVKSSCLLVPSKGLSLKLGQSDLHLVTARYAAGPCDQRVRYGEDFGAGSLDLGQM